MSNFPNGDKPKRDAIKECQDIIAGRKSNPSYRETYSRAVESECDGDAFWLIREAQSDRKALDFARTEQVLIDKGINYQVLANRLILLEHRGKEYYFYYSTNKWRAKGYKTFYRSAGITQFLNKYVL
ncbi:MAG: hypothetical protein RMZ41_001805 [Nostoc sp. DedVER02]|uniref:hypothetical protein n=1 Tax=unclassified Nostoc TaxID=2593658 RepID=UPI002AD3D3C5|nr:MULTISPECIES: hypothetical protein [unclassified Nostoc]MDZ7987106.1 hypothetical protein [Nostoc sp. DedVER02]MDZ8111024.1 hypothetical protein [Nostoc sp. DedVER01b]